MIAKHEIVVNGERRVLEYDEQAPLLYVLRNKLGLKGTRFGCGEGECGACTVLVDGVSRQSCQLPIAAVSGQRITTIEGVGSEGRLNALQEAFLRHQAGQCGYCLSGMIMAAMPLLASDQPVSRAAIREALALNLCRCGVYGRIVDAVAEAWGGVGIKP